MLDDVFGIAAAALSALALLALGISCGVITAVALMG